MLPGFNIIWGIIESVAEAIFTTLIDIVTTFLKSAFDLIICDDYFETMYTMFENYPICYLASGVILQIGMRKFVFAGSPNAKEDKPNERIMQYTEDISLGALLAWHCKEIFISILILPFVIAISILTIPLRLPQLLITLLVDILEALLDLVIQILVAFFEAIFELIVDVINSIMSVVDAIKDVVDSIMDALP